MAYDCPKLREHEQLLRRCSSISIAKKRIPALITDAESSSSALLLEGQVSGKSVYKLKRLQSSVYFIPSFLDGHRCHRLAQEILHNHIDDPPHANNFNGKSTGSSMWREYSESSSLNSRLDKLRWSCVGYHYNWGERTYDPEKFSNFPQSYRDIYQEALDCVNATAASRRAPLVGQPQSAIINFYHTHRISDRLGGHRDDVEATDMTPLVSVSMGVPGFFLIESEAIVLRPGDVLVMADEARQSLHGVPSIVNGDRRDSRDIEEKDSFHESDDEAIAQFMRKTRISISIRQVY
jgi:DNA alkylation damage repair protein AlkB